MTIAIGLPVGILSQSFFVEAQWSERDFVIGVGSGGPRDLIDGTLIRTRSEGFRYWSATFCGECPDEERNNEIMYHVGRPGEEGFTERILAAWGVDGHNSHTNICSSGARAGYELWCGIDRPSPDHANAEVILLVSAREWNRGAVPGSGVRLGSLTPLLLMLLIEKWVSISVYPWFFRVVAPAHAPPNASGGTSSTPSASARTHGV